MEIISNNQPRPVIDASELTQTEREEFDYLDWSEIEKGNDSATFFRYKGQLYDLGDCGHIGAAFGLQGWHGYYADTAWSGVLVRLTSDCDHVVVGRYYS